MKKVMSDRRASLDEVLEVKPAMRKIVEEEFRRGASIAVEAFPADGTAVPDTPRLTLVVVDPDEEWSGGGVLPAQLADWTRQRGKSPRLYPGALVWCLKKPGQDLHDKVEMELTWKRVAKEVADELGGEVRRATRRSSDEGEGGWTGRDEVWGGYRFALLADARGAD